MAYTVPDLPYDYGALEPHIDEATMRLHHDKHHQAYLDKVNAALEGTEWEDRPIEQVLSNLELIPEDKRTVVRNNGGGHANHSLFWEIMSPEGGGEPSGDLGAAIEDTFDSFDELKRQVNEAGVNRFGSEYTARPVPSQTSQVHPEPNRFTPASLTCPLSSSRPPNVSEIASASAPEGSPPPSGDMISQKSEWFAWPPALLRTGVALSPSWSRFWRTSSTGLSAHSVPSSAAFALST